MDGDPEHVVHDKRTTEEALARVLAGKAASSETVLTLQEWGRVRRLSGSKLYLRSRRKRVGNRNDHT